MCLNFVACDLKIDESANVKYLQGRRWITRWSFYWIAQTFRLSPFRTLLHRLLLLDMTTITNDSNMSYVSPVNIDYDVICRND
jgi:hypothetical protein